MCPVPVCLDLRPQPWESPYILHPSSIFFQPRRWYTIYINFLFIDNLFKYIILYLGKTGRKILVEALKNWKFDYEERKSLTNEDSIIVKIWNLKKKNG